ncbi:hypothetical protein RJG79_00750 [Mycoplasmatota bacterium WC44]
MKNSKLIIVAGMSGAGKSTKSQNLANQYQQNGIKNLWLHEEIDAHPIRDGEFSIGDLTSQEGMEKNISDMYQRWNNLVNKIANDDTVYIMEGCLYQSIIRYFFPYNYPVEKITEFYDSIMEIIAKLNPTIVFLYKSRLKESFEKAFEVRGKRWKSIILNPENSGEYFTRHKYSGDESIYEMEESYQNLANDIFERYNGNKIKIDTSNELWEEHMKEITKYIGLEYFSEKKIEIERPIEEYCGKYVLTVDDYNHTLEIRMDNDNKGIHCYTFWWENMKLIPLGNDEFQMQSFPIKLSFQFHENGRKAIYVTGTYGWKAIMNQTMWKI